MADDLSPPQQTNINRWLANTLRFTQGNPFATTAADQERKLLPKFYVDVDGYERIKGRETMIVFAPRGGGKSALRIVLGSYAAPVSPGSETLAVEYTDFDPFITKYHRQQHLTIDDYVEYLLRAGIKALVTAFCGDPANEILKAESSDNKQQRVARAASLPEPTRSRLARLVSRYYPTLIEPEILYEQLSYLDATFKPDWLVFYEYVKQQRLSKLIANSPLNEDGRARLLTDLSDYANTNPHHQDTPREQMETFVNLARAVKFTQVQFLIDRLDENVETADSPETQANVIEPLLANLPLLEIPGVAFKFFLSREARDVLMDRPAIRRDRLVDQAVTVVWDAKRLKHMLDARLDVYSDGRYQDLAQLFQDVRHEGSGRLLGEWVEDEMLHLAQGSPRRLLLAARLLCEAHVTGNNVRNLLEEADWQAAKVALMKKMPPTLRIHATKRTAYIGDRSIHLTPQQYKILLTLAELGGRCDRYTLIEKVWEAKHGKEEQDFYDAAVDRAIGRLRENLGDETSHPIYLFTERGTGFILRNYELV